jgi:hypothetical protein
MRKPGRTLIVLSFLIAALMALASATGLFWPALYRDNLLVTNAFRGNDLVTLALAVPLLVVGIVLGQRGSARWRLIWLGMLFYALYNYCFYLFAAAFNLAFVTYVLLLTLPTVALIVGLVGLDVKILAVRFSARTPVRWIAGFMLLFGALLAFLWLSRIVGFVSSGQVPQDVLQTGHPTAVVYALDLGILVPALLVSAVLLWQRRPWGYALATIVLAKASTYGLALIGMSLFAHLAGQPDAWQMVGLWVALDVGALAATAVLLANLRPAPAQRQRNTRVRST